MNLGSEIRQILFHKKILKKVSFVSWKIKSAIKNLIAFIIVKKLKTLTFNFHYACKIDLKIESFNF